jgi:hypothetical protein
LSVQRKPPAPREESFSDTAAAGQSTTGDYLPNVVEYSCDGSWSQGEMARKNRLSAFIFLTPKIDSEVQNLSFRTRFIKDGMRRGIALK